MNRLPFIFLVLAWYAIPGFLLAQGQWTLKKDLNNIQVYTSPVEGSNFLAFKGIAEINAPLEDVWNTLIDVERYTEWVYNTVKNIVLERPAENKLINYVITDAPWPVSDRDGCYQYEFIYQEGQSGKITILAAPNKRPVDPSLVRITKLKANWEAVSTPDGKTKVTYQAHSEPGGSIPAWLASSGVINFPYHTLQNLKKRLE